MATTTRILDANVNGTVYTTNANSALEALDTCHSGATAPTDEVANGKLWLDTSTTPGILKIYNNATWEVVHSGTVDINGGTIDGATINGTVIGGTTPAAVTTSSLVATTADINGGTVDGATIGGTAPSAITGTTLTATGAFTSLGIDDNAAATAMTIDSSGSVLVGKTVSSSATAGVAVFSSGFLATTVTQGTANVGSVAQFRRNSTDGAIANFYKDGTAVGSIGTYASTLAIGNNTTYLAFDSGATPAFLPSTGSANRDNAVDLGDLTARFDDIYATNATIQTSDRNEKQDIGVLSAAETAVAQACKGLMRKFRWKDAVAEKGDDARIHFGIIAQDLQDAFTAQGLDAGNYAMFISGTWWEADRIIPAVEAVAEELDEDGNVIVEAVEAVAEQTVTDTFGTLEEAPEGATERTRLGVRYPELLAFIIAAM